MKSLTMVDSSGQKRRVEIEKDGECRYTVRMESDGDMYRIGYLTGHGTRWLAEFTPRQGDGKIAIPTRSAQTACRVMMENALARQLATKKTHDILASGIVANPQEV